MRVRALMVLSILATEDEGRTWSKASVTGSDSVTIRMCYRHSE